jgi:hypothetical protein
MVTRATNVGPVSESLQGKNPRGMISELAADAMGISASRVCFWMETKGAKQRTAMLQRVVAVMVDRVGSQNGQRTEALFGVPANT